MDSSFTDTEKRFVLAEIIKVSRLDVSTLVDFVRSYNVEPDWLSMQLPGGRNMNQVIRAYETMFQVQAQQPPIPISHLKRKSIDDVNESMPKRLAMSPVEQHPPPLQAPQPLPPPSAGPFHFSRNVNIQPRPAPNGYQTLVPIAGSPPIVSPAGSVRKRGRPSKADKEARANASTGYVPVAPMPSQTPQPTYQTNPAPPPTSVPSPPEQNPAAPPPPPPPPARQSPYQTTIGSYGAPNGGVGGTGGGRGRSPAASASGGSEEVSKSGLVRWRPITSPSDFPAMDKKGLRAVSDSAVQRAPREAKNFDRPERSPSVSNLISAPDADSDYSTTRAAATSRYSPTAAQASAAAGHRIYGTSGGGGGGQAKPAVDHLKHENNGHTLNAHAPVSNPA